MPFRGLFLTGGVTKKNADWLQKDGSFMDAFRDKGRVSPLIDKVPLFLVRNDDMGQRGAHYRAVQLLKRTLAGQGARVEAIKHFSAKDLPAPREVLTDPALQKDLLQAMADYEKLAPTRGTRKAPIRVSEQADYVSVHKSSLWKLNQQGNPMTDKDWNSRDMSISKNGCLTYYSIENETSCVYWNSEELRTAVTTKVTEGSCKSWAFRVQPASRDGADFAASTFAAETEELREAWMSKLQALALA